MCRKQFAKQIELNRHTVEDHDCKFLCSQWTCKKLFTPKAALDKPSITYKPPCSMCSVCGREFYQKYQFDSHKNVHDPDKEFRCAYPRSNHVYKSQGKYNHHYGSHCGEYKEFECPNCDKTLQKRRTWTSTWNSILITSWTSAKPVGEDSVGGAASGCTFG